jgi:hypothetical protein
VIAAAPDCVSQKPIMPIGTPNVTIDSTANAATTSHFHGPSS